MFSSIEEGKNYISKIIVKLKDKHVAIPAVGSLCFFAYNTHMVMPKGISRICPSLGARSLNILLLTSQLGLGYHVYQRLKIKKLPGNTRNLFTYYITIIHHFGSFLLAFFLGRVTYEHPLVNMAFAWLYSYVNLRIGYDLLKLLDFNGETNDKINADERH